MEPILKPEIKTVYSIMLPRDSSRNLLATTSANKVLMAKQDFYITKHANCPDISLVAINFDMGAGESFFPVSIGSYEYDNSILMVKAIRILNGKFGFGEQISIGSRDGGTKLNTFASYKVA